MASAAYRQWPVLAAGTVAFTVRVALPRGSAKHLMAARLIPPQGFAMIFDSLV